jgi:hypothetical protein
MSISKFTNFASTTITGIASGATTINCATGDGSKFEGTVFPYYVVVWNVSDYASPDTAGSDKELFKVTARTSDAFTVVGAQQGTTAQNHNTAGKTYAMEAVVTATDLNDIVAKSGDDFTGVAGLLGGIKLPMSAVKTAAYTALASDFVINIDNSGGSATLLLRSASFKQAIIINNVGASGAVTVSVPGGEDIRNGSTSAATLSVAAGSKQFVIGDGSTRTYRVL